MTDDKNITNKPYFDMERAKTMINKRVLIGLTFYDDKGTFLKQKQMHGIITIADEHQGFEIALEGSHDGEIYILSPDLRSFLEDPPPKRKPYRTICNHSYRQLSVDCGKDSGR